MTPQYWMAHPGRNPAHRFGKGRDRWKVSVPVVPPAFSSEGVPETREVTMLGPKNPSRWLPHQGERECARRVNRIKEQMK